jgi:hypothetical protein
MYEYIDFKNAIYNNDIDKTKKILDFKKKELSVEDYNKWINNDNMIDYPYYSPLIMTFNNEPSKTFFNKDMAKLLIDYGADISYYKNSNDTILLITSLSNNLEAFIFFLNYSIDLNKQNNSGLNLLINISLDKQVQFLKILLDYVNKTDLKLDPYLKTISGYTALDHAVLRSLLITKMFLDFGVDPNYVLGDVILNFRKYPLINIYINIMLIMLIILIILFL